MARSEDRHALAAGVWGDRDSSTLTVPKGDSRRVVKVAGRAYPLVLPSARDPRLHLAAVIVSLQVLGQTALRFELSVAQILLAVATCAGLEILITFVRRGVIMWPASALLTGNGVAFLLRVPGTAHGDWWSLRGAWIFAGAAALSMLSKYVIRVGGRHLFNPSNIGLVACFVLLGTRRANPQDLWWGPISPGLAVTLAIIVIGGLSIVWRLRMLGLVIAFWTTFAASVSVVAASGHCMKARWHVGPVCGGSFRSVLVTSPEILVFMFFMITDPKTAPRGRVARVVYGIGVAFAAALLAAPAGTEFATKVGVLGGLAVICAIRPLMERFLPRTESDGDHLRSWLAELTAASRSGRSADQPRRRFVWPGVIGLGSIGACTGLLVVAGIPARSGLAAAAPAVRPAQTVARPVVSLDLAAVPPVVFDSTVRDADPSLTEQSAKRMAQDLVADLMIEADALRQRDAGLAATAATGSALRAIQAEIASASPAGNIVVPSYRIDSIRAVLVHDPSNPQNPAQLGFDVHGVVRRLTFGGSPPTSAIGHSDAGGEETFVLAGADDHFLVASGGPIF